MIENIPDAIINLAMEFKAKQNDGFAIEGARKHLIEIKEFIERVLEEDKE